MISSLKLGEVKLLSSIFKDRVELDKAYLKELNSMSLLQNFYLEAGVIMPGMQNVPDPLNTHLHWGWEAPVSQLRGHFLGHWMSAASVIIATEGDEELRVKLEYIVNELKRCQEINGGEWVGSIPEKYFERLTTDDYIWSPQYTMHKTALGLMDAYRNTGNETALEVLDKLSNWYIRWTDEMKKRCPKAIHKGEEGGMLEVWAIMYELTGKDKYMQLAKIYAEQGIFESLASGKDPLTNNHMNASIPHAHGAAMMYRITGDEYWHKVIDSFWKVAVEDRQAYCTGGQGSGEFWVPALKNSQFIGDRTQEFCTVYNMVRFADYMFKYTGESKYLDYIERNIYNGFLAQQNKFTGMPTYFLPMTAGAKKTWGSKRNDFWCCSGTMVQAPTLYSSLTFYQVINKDANAEKVAGADNDVTDRIIVAQYIPAELDTELSTGSKVNIIQKMDMEHYDNQSLFDELGSEMVSRWKYSYKIKSEDEFVLSFRIPEWVDKLPIMIINGQKIDLDGCNENMNSEGIWIKDGFINVLKKWEDGEISILMMPTYRLSELPDRKERVAILDGPIVLAAVCEKGEVPSLNGQEPEKALNKLTEHTYDKFPWQQNTYVMASGAKDYTFRALYDITYETYTMYIGR